MLKFIDDCDYLSSIIFREEIATWFLRMIHKTTLHATWEVHNEIWNSILVVNHCYRWICLTRISILLNISSSWAASFNNYTSQYENTVLIQKIFNKAIYSNSTTNPPFHRNIIPVYIHQEKKTYTHTYYTTTWRTNQQMNCLTRVQSRRSSSYLHAVSCATISAGSPHRWVHVYVRALQLYANCTARDLRLDSF